MTRGESSTSPKILALSMKTPLGNVAKTRFRIGEDAIEMSFRTIDGVSGVYVKPKNNKDFGDFFVLPGGINYICLSPEK
jgi:hypothetical protein